MFGKIKSFIIKILRRIRAHIYNIDDNDISIIWAAIKKPKKLVAILIDCGANVNVKDIHGNTPMIHTAAIGRIEIVELLIKNGAKIDEKNNHGYTALMLAVREGHTEIVKLLLEKGAKINEKDNDGNTALIWAVENGHQEIVQLLIDNGADINVKDDNGGNALMYAVINKNTKIIRLLLDNGAKNIQNSRGETSFKLVIEYQDKKMLRLFLTHHTYHELFGD